MDEIHDTDTPADHGGPAGPEERIGHWLSVVDRLFSTHVDACLEEHGLTRHQWALMNALTAGPAEVDRLAPLLPDEDRHTLDEQLTELADSGWVVLTRTEVTLTDTGMEAGTRVATAVDGLRERAAAEVPAEEYAAAVATLRRIGANLGHPGA